MDVNDYIEFCMGNANFENNSQKDKALDNIDGFDYFKTQYVSLVNDLNKLANFREKLIIENQELRKIEVQRIAYFHKTEQDIPQDIFSTEIQEKKKKIELRKAEIANLEKTLKEKVNEAQKDIEQFNTNNGKLAIEMVKEQNDLQALKLIPEFESQNKNDKENYTPELIEIMSYQANQQINLNMDAFEAISKLINEIKSGKVNLGQHTKKANEIQGKQKILDIIDEKYTRSNSDVVMLCNNSLGNDKKYIEKAYQTFSDIVEGKEVDINDLNYVESGHRENLSKEMKPRLGLRIANFVRSLIGKNKELPSVTDSVIQTGRMEAMQKIYDTAYEYLEKNNYIKQNDFDKSLSVQLIEKDINNIPNNKIVQSKDADLEIE